ncbi:MAG: AMP-binding protein [Actinomycetota bacterium]
MASAQPYLLSHLLDASAERDASATALVDDDATLDAAGLAERVARLAGALVDGGVADGDRVMVFAAKSADTYIAMHAAMHAGAIAVPVNARAGTDAVRTLIDAIEPSAVVLDRQSARAGPTDVAPRLSVGHDAAGRHLPWDAVDGFEPLTPRTRTGDDPAYMITTSGSTGTPKSIVHTHRSGLRYAELGAQCYGLVADDRMANVAAFHFDQSTFELYSGPLVGAAVVLVPEVLLRFPASVADLLRDESITIWYSVPTILRQLLERGALEADHVRTLRWVLFGGELFPPAELRAWMELAPNARFSNVYGPAEVNQCTFHHLESPPADDESIPIGRAWDDTRCRIEPTGSDPRHGELLVATTTAMEGYWGRPDLTDAAFEVTTDAGAMTTRWYRTGDLVDEDDHGRLHFRGRVDRQVKVRGVRIELESVESTLDAIDGVTASAAGVTSTGALGALVTTSGLDETALRAAVRAASAPGAEPEFLEIVDDLPRTGSDKIDHATVADRIAALDAAPPAARTTS